MSTMRSMLDLIAALLIAFVLVYFLPNDAASAVTTELIAFFSIQSAVILPAMIFTAGVLRPDGLEIKDAERYHVALRRQMHFWITLLGLDLVAVLALIAGKAMDWQLLIDLPRLNFKYDAGWVVPSVAYVAGILALFRTVPFVKGVLSLLELNAEMTKKAILRRNRIEGEQRRIDRVVEPMKRPEGYGRVRGEQPSVSENGDR